MNMIEDMHSTVTSPIANMKGVPVANGDSKRHNGRHHHAGPPGERFHGGGSNERTIGSTDNGG